MLLVATRRGKGPTLPHATPTNSFTVVKRQRSKSLHIQIVEDYCPLVYIIDKIQTNFHSSLLIFSNKDFEGEACAS